MRVAMILPVFALSVTTAAVAQSGSAAPDVVRVGGKSYRLADVERATAEAPTSLLRSPALLDMKNVARLLAHPSLGVVVSNDHPKTLWLYLTDKDLDQALDDLVAYTKKTAGAYVAPSAPRANLGGDEFVTVWSNWSDDTFRGYGSALDMIPSTSHPDLRTVGWDNVPSGVHLYSGSADLLAWVTFGEHPDFGGKRLTLTSSRLFPTSVSYYGLNAYCLKSFVFCYRSWDNQASSAQSFLRIPE